MGTPFGPMEEQSGGARARSAGVAFPLVMLTFLVLPACVLLLTSVNLGPENIVSLEKLEGGYEHTWDIKDIESGIANRVLHFTKTPISTPMTKYAKTPVHVTTEVIVHIKGLIGQFDSQKETEFAKKICAYHTVKCNTNELQLTKTAGSISTPEFDLMIYINEDPQGKYAKALVNAFNLKTAAKLNPMPKAFPVAKAAIVTSSLH